MRIGTISPSKRAVFCGLLLTAASLWAFAPGAAGADKAQGEKIAEAAIRATAGAFIQAFNRGDAKAVAALWTENGSLTDEQGRIFKGRKAIEAEYAAFFEQHPGAKMEVTIQSVEVPAPDTAIEDGLARVAAKEGPAPAASRYTAVHVLVDGKWLMAGVRETGAELPSNQDRLRELEWLVGNWELKSEAATLQTSIRWIAERNFLERQYTVRRSGETARSGIQIIGWDPQSNQVRSWSFDSMGGHGTGVWTPTPDGWRIDSLGVLADGTPTSSQDFVIRVPREDNVFGWRSVGRKVGAMDLPDTREIVLERIAAQQKH